MKSPTMSLSWNVILTILLAGAQMLAVQSDLLPPQGVKWMIFIASFVKMAQVIVAGNSNPDGTPAQVGYVPKDKQ